MPFTLQRVAVGKRDPSAHHQQDRNIRVLPRLQAAVWGMHKKEGRFS